MASQDTDKDNRGSTGEDQRGLCCLTRGIRANKQAPQPFLHVTAGRDTLKLCAKSQSVKAFPFEARLKGIYKDCRDTESKILAWVKTEGEFVH